MKDCVLANSVPVQLSFPGQIPDTSSPCCFMSRQLEAPGMPLPTLSQRTVVTPAARYKSILNPDPTS